MKFGGSFIGFWCYVYDKPLKLLLNYTQSRCYTILYVTFWFRIVHEAGHELGDTMKTLIESHSDVILLDDVSELVDEWLDVLVKDARVEDESSCCAGHREYLDHRPLP